MSDIQHNQFDLELWLATFHVKASEQNLTGFTLQKAVQKRAETYYQREWKQPHHTLTEWAFMRFRLEMALIQTIDGTDDDIVNCYSYHQVLAGLAYRETYTQDHRLRPDPSAETPF